MSYAVPEVSGSARCYQHPTEPNSHERDISHASCLRFYRYNGWHNYETWCVNLWMSNDQGSDEFYREMAQGVWNDCEPELRQDRTVLFTRTEVATRNLAEELKDDHEQRQSELTGVCGVFADLLTAALSEVDWHEIAEHYISDLGGAE